MKAVIYKKYGSPDVLELKEVKKPVPGDDEVLVKIHATSINSSDWELLTGKPFYTRIWGLFKPSIDILGSDIAGRVEEVGKDVESFQPGDAVFGDVFGHWGGFAEYACVPEHLLMLKPKGITFEEAASLPQASLVALQGIRDSGMVKPGQKVLINGAGGGAGTFAIQIAKNFGAEVTGVDHTRKLDMMSETGADHVIDYTREDFTKNGRKYDLILDLTASHSLFDYKRSLEPNGKYLMVGGSVPHLIRTLTLGSIISKTGGKKMGLLAHRQNKGLGYIIDLVKNKKLKPVIHRLYPLEEVHEALTHLGAGHFLGKVVIAI